MSLVLNRAQQLSTTTGTGTANLDGAGVTPFRSWASAGAVSGRYYSYLIEDTGNAWEVGVGLYTAGSPDTLTRVVTESSAAMNAALSLSGGATISCVEAAVDQSHALVENKNLSGLSTYTISNIPAGFDDLELYLEGAQTGAVTVANPAVQVNGLSTGIYSVQRIYAQNTPPASDQTLLGTSWTPVGFPGSSVTSGTRGFERLTIHQYASNLRKVGEFIGRQPNNNTTMNAYHLSGNLELNLTAPITSLTVISGSGNFTSDTFAKLTVRR